MAHAAGQTGLPDKILGLQNDHYALGWDGLEPAASRNSAIIISIVIKARVHQDHFDIQAGDTFFSSTPGLSSSRHMA